MDHRLFGNHAIVLFIGRWPFKYGEYGLVVTKDHQVFLSAVPKVVMNAFLLAKPLDEMQI
ncbi:hypothetical protein D3C71_1970930 [compost metagenome]